MQPTVLITIDVEDWFQVENFKSWIPFDTWDQCELRVERNVHRLLGLFDSIELKPPNLQASKPQAHNYELSAMNFKLNSNGQRTTDNGHTKKVQATFFVLGWLAERLPNLVREIHSRGHEIASHGYNHNLCNQQSHADLKKELTDSKKLLEDITGSRVFGFRAPNFSINNDILKIIEDCGYLYDSSYNSFGLHRRYGKISLNGDSKKGIAHKVSENLFELPISNLTLRNPMSYLLSAMNSKRNDRKLFTLPFGGGGYFRLIPRWFFQHGVQSILKKDGAYVFYMHPWELDAEQPRVDDASHLSKFKHYNNIRQSKKKLKKMANNLSYCQFVTCKEYLKLNKLD
jgi:polysaccharide deacetylase family protein (PEP-CTERM system associated)